MSKRIAVVGTGANGGAVAADLTRAGLDVTLIEQWPANVQAMRERGLRVEMPGLSTVTPVTVMHLCEVATLREPFDVVLVMVKAYDTRWATELIKPLLTPDSLVVGVQNGMTLDAIAEIVGPERTLGCVIECGGAMWDPGVVERDTPPSKAWFAVGACDDRTRGREGEIVELLSHSGTVQVFDDVRTAKWMKLVVNAAEVAPTAILSLPMDAAIEVPGMRPFMVEVGREAFAVGEAIGHPITPIFGLPDLDLSDPGRLIEYLLDTVISHFGQPDSKTAMLQDWDKGRRSEVDHMNGVVVDEARRVGIAVPFNERVLELSHRIERGELIAQVSNVELLVADLEPAV